MNEITQLHLESQYFTSQMDNNDKELHRDELAPTWRLRDRMKTTGVCIILALNIGTDPPDVSKPNPCAKLQCWMDPSGVSRSKAREIIGERLEEQYAKWQQRVKLRYVPDSLYTKK